MTVDEKEKAPRFAFLIIFAIAHLAHVQRHTSQHISKALQKSQISLSTRTRGQKQDMLLIIQIKWIYLCNMLIIMGNKTINRLKVVLAEKNCTNKWLAKQLDKNETTVSRWCTNDNQPSVDTLSQIAELLDVDIRELLLSTKNDLRY